MHGVHEFRLTMNKQTFCAKIGKKKMKNLDAQVTVLMSAECLKKWHFLLQNVSTALPHTQTP